jgi:hypothetical protein
LKDISPKRFRRMPLEFQVAYDSVTYGVFLGLVSLAVGVMLRDQGLSLVLASAASCALLLVGIHLILVSIDRRLLKE